MHGCKNSIVREFLGLDRQEPEPVWDGGRTEDDTVMESGEVPVLGIKVDANEAAWYLQHKDYSQKISAGEGHSSLPTED